jgi:hypothetical protein
MNFLRRRLAALLVLALLAIAAIAVENQGLADNRPIVWRVTKKSGTDAYLEAEGGALRYSLHGDEGGAELAEGASIELQCRKRREELRCIRDTYGARMAKLGGAFVLGLLLLGLVLSPEIRDRLEG